MLKKLAAVFLLGLLLLSVHPVQAGEEKVVDLEDAIELALAENRDLQIAELELDNARLNYRKSKAENLISESTYNRLEAEYNLARALKTYTNTRDQVIMETINEYSGLLMTLKTIEIREKNVQLQQFLLDNVRSQVEVGEKGQLDLMKQENEYNNAKFEREQEKRNYEQSIDEIKILLGLSADIDLQLQELDHPRIMEITEEEALEQAFENNFDLILAAKDLELARRNLERLQVSTTSELDMQMTENNLEIKKIEKIKTENNIESSLKEKFFDYKQAVRNMELKEENLSTSRENYRMVEKQYEAGLKTEIELLNNEISLLQAQSEYFSGLSSYYLQEHKLQQEIKSEAGVLNDEIEEIQ